MTGLTRAHALGLLAATAAATAARRASAQALKLRVGAVTADSYAEPYYALDGGFFGRAGLEVDITPFSTGGQITNALAGGALDVAIADPIQVGNGFIRGVPFGFFAGSMYYTTGEPTTQLCVLRDGPIKTARDLTGKTLGVNGLRSMAEFAGRDWLHSNGVELETVQFVEIPPSAMPAAIARGTVSAGMVSEPGLTIARELGVVPFAKAYDACAKLFYINSWFANREWLAKNPETVRKLTGAIYAAARWANGHHAETLPILAKYAKLDVERLHGMNRAVYDTALDPKKLQPPLDIAWKYHALEKQITAADLIVRV